MASNWKDNPAAVAISDFANEVRSCTSTHPERTGWIIRPHHTKRCLQIGHKLAGEIEYLEGEIQTLMNYLNWEGTCKKWGYEVVRISA
jgi:hypothetical protein